MARFVLESRANPDDDWGNRRTVTRIQMLNQVRKFSWGKGPVQLRSRGTDFGGLLRPIEALRRLARRTALNGLGYKAFVRRKDGRVLSIHKIKTPIMSVGTHYPGLGDVHPTIQKGFDELAAHFGTNTIRNGGCWFCRFVDGTDIVSHHGYLTVSWKGGAGDIFVNPDVFSLLLFVAKYLVSIAPELGISRVIVGDQVWDARDGQWHPYAGVFHRHIHFEVDEGSPCSP